MSFVNNVYITHSLIQSRGDTGLTESDFVPAPQF